MVDMESVRWGVVGPGRIAAKVVRDFVHMPDAEVVAVASRSAERARAFADANGITRAHGSYRAIVEDDEVDALYIATPHPQHRAVALAAIKAGKALLVEKSFTVTPAATREIAAAAGDAGVFVMEAMWTRFQPAVVRLRELLADGAIGEVRGVQGELGVNAPTDPQDRYHHPDTIVLHRTGREPEEITRHHTGGGYVHELREVTDGVLAGRVESTVMPLADTIAVQDVLGAVADQLGTQPQEGP